ncbi:PTS sugar transporter subunit IIA [Caproiciproducens sp. NJN-50]|uniref:PTS sugar transporter subunit IIA n=1 Tax=Caproiciproducens sp. NJN-50 TaxID=2507162 RepID=UPI0013E8E8D4|nr:glucose PTS transporter subunit IIA [Caproiciproducens sp. NJN-50]
MFNLFSREKRRYKDFLPCNALLAVADGYLVPMEKVPDEVFSQKILGDGVAIQISSQTICSPANGMIDTLAPHAFGLVLPNKIEVMVHIGVDTVSMGGKGFKVLAAEKSQVKQGDPVIRVDKDFLENKGFNLITMVVVTDARDFQFRYSAEGTVQAGKSVLATYEKCV